MPPLSTAVRAAAPPRLLPLRWLLALCLLCGLAPTWAQGVGSTLLGQTVSQVATGSTHTCALTTAGAVQCWGYNGDGQTTVPAGLPAGGAAAIATGGTHTCALTTAGAVQCWGDNGYGQTTVPPSLQIGGAAAIAAGSYHTCALTTAGAVQCWGLNGTGQAPATAFAGQALGFAPGGAGTPLRTLALGASTPLTATPDTGGAPGGNQPATYTTWTSDTCTVSGSTLTAIGPIGSLCGVAAARAGQSPMTAAAPTQMRLLLVTKALPALALSASPASPSTLGQAVTFTAALTGAANPSGAITFTDGTASLCTATLPAHTCTATLTAGAHSIAATYAGDANNAAATAPALAHQVNAASLPVSGGTAQVSISGPAGCTLAAPPTLTAATLAGAPAQARAPLGALAFTATGCAGATLTVSIAYPTGALTGLAPYKFGPASAGAAPTWFPHGSITGDTFTYTVEDDGVGDQETTTPGMIRDPAAPLLLAAGPGGAQAIPTLGEWGLLLLSALLGLLGLGASRKKIGDC